MMAYDSIKNIRHLVTEAGKLYQDRVFLRSLQDDVVQDITFEQFTRECNAIAAWAEDDFRSVNGQIEYLLTECVKQRKKNGGYVSTEMDKPFDLDFLKEE